MCPWTPGKGPPVSHISKPYSHGSWIIGSPHITVTFLQLLLPTFAPLVNPQVSIQRKHSQLTEFQFQWGISHHHFKTPPGQGQCGKRGRRLWNLADREVMVGCFVFLSFFFSKFWIPSLLPSGTKALGGQYLGLAFKSQWVSTEERIPDARDNGLFKAQNAAQYWTGCMWCSFLNTYKHSHFHHLHDGGLFTAENARANSNCKHLSPPQKGRKK